MIHSGDKLEIREASTVEWDTAVAQDQSATFFQSRSWSQVWEKSTAARWQPRPMMARQGDAFALAPLSVLHAQVGPLKVQRAVCAPGGTFGSFLVSGSSGRELVEPLMDWLIRQRFFELVVRSSPYGVDIASCRESGTITHDLTHTLNLSEGFDAVLKRWRKGHRAAAAQGERNGLHVRKATSEADWREYFTLYLSSLERWGEHATSRYDWALFEELSRLPESQLDLWLAEKDGQMAAGALCLKQNTHVAYWHGAASADLFSLRPVHLLLREAIRCYGEQGFEWFDFNPSGGHEGVVHFKRGFGCQELPSPVFRIASLFGRMIDQTASAVNAVKKRLRR